MADNCQVCGQDITCAGCVIARKKVEAGESLGPADAVTAIALGRSVDRHESLNKD